MIESGVFKNTHGAYMLRNLLKLSLFVIGVMSAPPKAAGGAAAPTLMEQIAHAIAPAVAAAEGRITLLTHELEQAQETIATLQETIVQKDHTIAALQAALDANGVNMPAPQVAAKNALLDLIENTSSMLDGIITTVFAHPTRMKNYWSRTEENGCLPYLNNCIQLAEALSNYYATYHPYQAQPELSQRAIVMCTTHLKNLHDIYTQPHSKIGEGTGMGLIFDSKQAIFDLLDRYVRGQVVSMPTLIRSLTSLKLLEE